MKKALLIFLSLSILLNIALVLHVARQKPATKTDTEHYPFLSKRIFVDNNNEFLINFTQLRTHLRDYMAQADPNGYLYFEYMPSGTSIGIREEENFYPASLLKVPIVMAVYKELEQGTVTKNDMIIVTKDMIDPKFGSLWKRGAGTRITVGEAIGLTLRDSDNTAKNALLSLLKKPGIEYVLDSLDLAERATEADTVISLKNYASIFRSLYLSSYLTEDSSNEILAILAETNHNDGIPSGVPKSIKVSHKIGVAQGTNNTSTQQSDCGIVYAPKRPFLICISSDKSPDYVNRLMGSATALAYTYVINSGLK